MLVLSRRWLERVFLHDRYGKHIATIQITRIEGGQVWLGIEAPPSVVVLREELVDRKESLDGQK